MSKKRFKAQDKARLALLGFLQTKGMTFRKPPRTEEILAAIEPLLDITPPPVGAPFSKKSNRMIDGFRVLRGLPLRTPPIPVAQREQKAPVDEIKAFYRSYDWRRVRYDALAKNDGRCELCGASKHEGATLNVDHIKPVRKHWHLRLDASNLQVLCSQCNHGKGNRDETDWRPGAEIIQLKVAMGERIG